MRKLVARIPLAELPAGTMKRIAYPPYDVLVANIEGVYCAIEDSCAHAGASLCDGDLEGFQIACPAHGYIFDVRTGELIVPKGLCDDQRPFVVEREGDELVVYDPVTSPLVSIS